jgi:hypothetical protein
MKPPAVFVSVALMVVAIAATISCETSPPSLHSQTTSTRGQTYFGECVEEPDAEWRSRFHREYAAAILDAMGEPPLSSQESLGDLRTYRILISRSVNEQTAVTLSMVENACTITKKTLDRFAALVISGDTEEILEFEAGDLRVESVPCSINRAERIEEQFKLLGRLPDTLPGPSMVDEELWLLEAIGVDAEHTVRIVWGREPLLRELAQALSSADKRVEPQ